MFFYGKDPGEAREAPEPCTKPTRPCLKYTKNKSVEYDFLEQHKENIQKVDQLIEEAKNSIQALKREFYQVSQDHMKKIAEGREDDSCLCLASDNPNEKQKAVPHLYSVVKKRDQMPKFYYKSASVADSTSYTSLDPCVCSSDELKSTFDEDVTDESPKRTDADAIDDTDTDNAEVMPEAVSDALEVIIENSTEDVPRNSEQQEEKITDRTQPQTKNLAGMCQECNEDKPENAKRIFANIRYEIIVYSGTDRDLRERSNALVSKFVKEKVEPVLIDETLNLVRQCHLKEQAEPCHLEEQIPKRSTRTESTPTSTDANVIPVVSGDTESLPTVQEQTEETKQPPDKTPLRVCDCEEGLNTVDKEQEHAQKGTDVTAKINEELAALCNCSDEESEEKQRSTEVKIKRSSVHFSKESMHKGTSPDLLENGKELRHSSTSTDQDQKSAPTIKASGDDLKEERKDVKQSTSLASTLSRKLSCLPSLSAIRSKSKVSISGSQIAPKRSVSTRSTPPNRGAIKTLSKGKEIEAKSASVLNMEVAPDAEQATAETNVIRDVSGNAEILANSREQAEEEKPSEQASLSGKKPIRVCDCEEGPKSVDRELAALCDCSDEEDEEKQTQNSDLLDEEEELPHSSASTDADQRSVPTQNTSGDDPEEKKTKVIKESKDKLIDAQQTTSETNVIPDVSGNTESIHSGQEQTEENKPSEQIFPSRKQTFRICDCEQGPKPVDKELAALCECSDEEDEEKQASEEENPEQTIPSGEKRLRICDCEEGPIEPIDKELTALCDCTDEEDEEKPTSNEPRIGTSSVRHSKAHAIPDVPGDTESMPSAPPDYEEISPSGSKIQQNTKSTSRTKSTPASRGTSRILSKGRKIEGSESTINDEHTTNETNVTPDVPADTQSLPSAPPAYDEISTSDSKIEQKPKSKYATRILSKIKGKSASVVNTEATPDAEQATGETNVAPRALKDTKNLPSAPPEYEKVSISDSNIERKRKSSSRSRSTPISRDASKALPKDKKIEAKSGRVLNRKATPDAGQTTDETNVIPNVLNVLSDVPKQTDKKQTSSAPRIARRKEGMPKSSIPSERKTSKSSVVSHKPLSDVNLSQKGDTSSVRSVSASSSEGESEDVDKVDKEIQEDVEVDEKNISVTEKDFVVDENPQLNSISEERTPSSENDQTENLHEAGRSYVSTRYASGQSNAAPAQVQSLSSPSRNDTKMPKSPSTPRRKPRYSTRSPTVMPVLVQYDRDDVEKRLQSVIYPDGKLSIKGPSELKKKPHHKKSPKSKTRSLEGKYESAESQTTRRVRNARSGTGDSRKSKKSSSNTATQTVKAESGHQKIQASLDPAASLKSIQDSRSNFSAYNDRGFTVKPLVKLSVLVDNTVPDISNLGLAKASHLISAKKSRSRQDAPNTTTTDGRNTTLSSVQVSISPPKTPHRKSRISGSGKSGSSVATRLSNDSLPGYLSDISTTRIHDDSVPNEDMPRLCLKIGATIRPRSQQSTQSSQVKLDSVKVSVDKRPSSSPFHSAVRLTSPSPDLDAPPKEKVGNRSPISPHLKAKLKEDSLKSGSYQTKQTAHQQTSKRSLSPDDIAKTPMPMSKIYYAMYTTESGSSNYYRFRPSNRFLYEAPGGCISPNREVSRSHGERPQVVLAADDQMVRLASSARHLARGSSQFSIDDDMDYNLPTKRKTSPPGEERDRESNESNVNISVSLKLLPKVQRYDNEEYNVTSRPSKSEAHVGKLEIDILPPHSNETSEVSGNPVADISVSSQRSDINAHSKSRISLANYKIVYQVFGSRSSSSSQFMRMPSPDNPNNVKEAHADKENQLSDAIAKPNEKENLHSINEAESESRTTESESVLISETSQQQRLKTEVQNEPQPQKKEDDSSRASFSCQLPAEFLDSTYTLKYVHGLNAQERETFSHCDYADEETEADKSTSLSGSEEPTFEPKTSTLSSSQQMNTEENNCSPTTQEAETPSKKLSGDVADPAPAQTITAVEAIRSDNRQIGNDSLQGRAPVFTSLEFFPASDQTGLLVTEDTRISNLKQPELNQVTWSKIVLRDDFDGEARVAATDLKSSTLSDQNMGANAENLDENTETHASMPQGKEFQRMYILTSHTQENLLKPPILSQETCAVGIITDNLNEVIGEAKDPENGISETRQGTEELEDTSETTLDELADLENAKKKAETYVPVGTSRTHTEIVTTKSEKIQLEPWLQEMGAENFSQTVTTFDVVKDGCAIYSDSRPMYAEAVFDPLEAMVGERMIGERHMKMLPLNKDVRKDTRAPVKERESRIDDAEPKKGLNNEISFKPLLDLSLTSSELSLLKCIESLHPQKVTSGDFNKREKTEECLPAPGSKSPKLKFGGAAEASAGLVVREFNEMVNAECVKTLAAKTEVTQSRVQEEKIQGSMPRSGQRKRLKGETAENFSQTLIEKDDKSVLKTYLDSDAPLPKAFVTSNTQGNVQQLTVEEGRGPSGTEDFQAGKSLKPYDTSTQTRTPILFPTEDKTLELCTYSDNLQSVQNFANDYLAYDPSTVLQDLNVQTSPGFDSSRRVDVSFAKIPETTEALDPDSSQATNLPQGIPTGASITITEQHSGTSTTVSEKSEFTNTYQTQTRTTITANSEHKILHNFTDYDTATSTSKPYIRGKRIQKTSKQIRSYSSNFHPTEETWTQVAGSEPRFAENVPLSMHQPSDPSIEENVKVSKLHSKGCCTPKAKRQKVSRTISASELHRNPAKPEDLHLKHLLVHPNGRYKDEAESFCEPAHAATPSTTDTSEQYQWKYLLNELEKVSPPVDVQSRHHTELKQAVHPGSSSKRKIEVKETIPKQSLKPHKRQRHLNRETLVSSSETPTENQVVSDFIVGLPTGKCRRSISSRYRHDSASIPSTSDFSKSTNLYGLLSEGEVKCGDSCISVGEVRLYPQMPRVTTKSNYLKRHPEKMLSYELAEDNIRITRRKAKYENWVTYYTSRDSSPSGSSSDT